MNADPIYRTFITPTGTSRVNGHDSACNIILSVGNKSALAFPRTRIPTLHCCIGWLDAFRLYIAASWSQECRLELHSSTPENVLWFWY